MYVKKECVAMLLAGGQGSRLYALTKDMAKPAVPYGGKYRIIDFALSNCTNSGIDTVGVLTQYQPLVLNEYIGDGQPWDLDRIHGGVHVLSPYQTAEGEAWFEDTANAIYRNIPFIDRYDPEYVLILGGDHIYTMDYSQMLDYHKKNNADCTIAVYNVTLEEASRFGIMICDDNKKVIDFAEKPKEPKSTLASMGIYIFNWNKLRDYLIDNEKNSTGTKDFGKDIIPNMLKANERLYAYVFEGYWKDVGTLDSLWDANIDLIQSYSANAIDLYDPAWKIYSRTESSPPQYVGPNATIENALIAEGSVINGFVESSVIYSGVTVEEGATVKYSVVMPNTVIKSGAVIEYCIVGENNVIEGRIGSEPAEALDKIDEWWIAVTGNSVTVPKDLHLKARQIMDKSGEIKPIK